MTSEDWENIGKNLGRLYFAGEATHDEWFGYMQGAYLSGDEKGKRIAEQISPSEPTSKPLKPKSEATSVKVSSLGVLLLSYFCSRLCIWGVAWQRINLVKIIFCLSSSCIGSEIMKLLLWNTSVISIKKLTIFHEFSFFKLHLRRKTFIDMSNRLQAWLFKVVLGLRIHYPYCIIIKLRVWAEVKYWWNALNTSAQTIYQSFCIMNWVSRGFINDLTS